VLGLAYRRLFPRTPIVSHTGHVIVERELREESGVTGPQRWLMATMLNRMERRAYATAGWTHVVSTRLVARQREAHYRLRPGFFQVRPLGVDRRRFDRAAPHPDVRAQLRIPADAFVVVTAARLVPWKNIELLLRAVALAAHRPVLIVAGHGPHADHLREVARTLGVAERVHFVGHTHPAPYLAAADVFALPSLIESFGMVYAEAMFMGLPCIGLRNDPPRVLSSAVDVIPEGVAGYCVSTVEELRDRLDLLAADPALRRRLGEQAHALATAEYSVERYCAFLHELAERAA
jgi:glycosyltransferase involved in cell wall biosynthesis